MIITTFKRRRHLIVRVAIGDLVITVEIPIRP